MPYFMLTSPANSFQGRLFYDMSFDSGKHLSKSTGTFRTLSASFFFPEMAEEVDAIVPWWNGTDGTCELRHLRLHLHRACEPGLIIT